MTVPFQGSQMTAAELARMLEQAHAALQAASDLLREATGQGLDFRPPAPEPPEVAEPQEVSELPAGVEPPVVTESPVVVEEMATYEAPVPAAEEPAEPAEPVTARQEPPAPQGPYAGVGRALEEVIAALRDFVADGPVAPAPEAPGANTVLDEFQARVEGLRAKLRAMWYLVEIAFWELAVQSGDAAKTVASFRRRVRDKVGEAEKLSTQVAKLRQRPASQSGEPWPETLELPPLRPEEVLDPSAAGIPVLRLVRWAEAVDSQVNRRLAAYATSDQGRVEEGLRPLREVLDRSLPEDLGMLWHAMVQVRTPPPALHDAIEKVEESLRPFSFERIAPEVGERYDQRLHSAARATGVIKSVLAPGYRLGRDIKKRALVETM